MIEERDITVKEDVVVLGTDLVYMHEPYWCNAVPFPLKMSLIRPRSFFAYDKQRDPMPVILWIPGGGWTEVDNNVWVPELVYYAKRGYLVASVSYCTSPTWVFPKPLVQIKQAIRYLRAHAKQLNIDPDRIAVMGESAGGHLAALVAATGDDPQFEEGEYLEYSSKVQAAVLYYPCIDMADFEGRGELESYDENPQYLLRGQELEPQSLLHGMIYVRKDPKAWKEMDPRTYVKKGLPPYLLFHGTADTLVPCHHSKVMYQALQDAGVEADLVLVRGAEHADHVFYQEEIKEQIFRFISKTLG